jgi:hypothetical protein
MIKMSMIHLSTASAAFERGENDWQIIHGLGQIAKDYLGN